MSRFKFEGGPFDGPILVISGHFIDAPYDPDAFDRFECLISAMNFRCRRRFRCMVYVKIFGAGAFWWPYLSYNWHLMMLMYLTGLNAKSKP